MSLAPVLSCTTVLLSNGLQIPVLGLGEFYSLTPHYVYISMSLTHLQCVIVVVNG